MFQAVHLALTVASAATVCSQGPPNYYGTPLLPCATEACETQDALIRVARIRVARIRVAALQRPSPSSSEPPSSGPPARIASLTGYVRDYNRSCSHSNANATGEVAMIAASLVIFAGRGPGRAARIAPGRGTRPASPISTGADPDLTSTAADSDHMSWPA